MTVARVLGTPIGPLTLVASETALQELHFGVSGTDMSG